MSIKLSLPSRGWQRTLLLVTGVIIWIAWIAIPRPFEDGIDPSWQAVLVDSHLKGRQFGDEIIFTFGPWGWLTSHFFVPDAMGAKLVWEIVGKLVLTASIVFLSTTFSLRRRWLFLLAMPLIAPMSPDIMFVVLIVLAMLAWVFRVEAPYLLTFISVFILMFIGQIKFTYTLLICAGVGLAAFGLAWRREWRRCAELVITAITAYLVWWLAAGQELKNIFDYWSYSWEISRGYPSAMAFNEPWKVFFIGAIVVTSGIVYAGSEWLSHAERRLIWPATVFVILAWMLIWKHGFVRADQHIMGFFGSALLLSLAIPGFSPFGRGNRWFLACPLVCILGMGIHYKKSPAHIAALPWEPFVRKVQRLKELPGVVSNFPAAWRRAQEAAAVPELKAVVGTDTVDLINYDQGLLLLNSLNHRPRPVFQSYSAYTPALMRKNLRFYQSPNAPEFVVVKMQTFDERNPVQEDSLVLAELPRRYDLIRMEETYALLGKQQQAGAPRRDLTRQLLSEHKIDLGELIQMPSAQDHALWLQVSLEPSLRAKVRGLMYKPPQAYMIAIDEMGRETRHRLVPLMAEEGFLVHPWMTSVKDYGDFIRGRSNNRITAFRLEPASRKEQKYWRGATVRVFAIPEFSLQNKAGDRLKP